MDRHDRHKVSKGTRSDPRMDDKREDIDLTDNILLLLRYMQQDNVLDYSLVYNTTTSKNRSMSVLEYMDLTTFSCPEEQ